MGMHGASLKGFRVLGFTGDFRSCLAVWAPELGLEDREELEGMVGEGVGGTPQRGSQSPR